MYVNMVCICDASFEMDTELEDACWLMTYRWVNGHVACGYALPAQNVEYAVKMELGPDDLAPDDPDDHQTIPVG
jgi:hypothetical protein